MSIVREVLDEMGKDTPAESSPAEVPDPKPGAANTETDDSPSSGAGESNEHVVPLRHLLEERRSRSEAERTVRELQAERDALLQRNQLFEAAKPEILEIVRANQKYQADLQAAMGKVAYLEQIEKVAKENGIELPDQEKHELKAALDSLRQEVRELRSAPPQSTYQQPATPAAQHQQDPFAAERERLRKEIEMDRAFEKQWETVLAKAPELDDVRDVAKERFMKDGGTKPVTSYFPRLSQAVTSSAARAQAQRQAAEHAAAPSPADSRQGNARPSQDVPMPKDWETMDMRKFLAEASRMR
jgi:hypothetical protein